MPARRFAVPHEIFFGERALDVLQFLQGKRALVLTDPTMTQVGLAKSVQSRLAAKGMECLIFDGVKVGPSYEDIDKALMIALTFAPDVIVALGGGSVIDTGKAICARYQSPSPGRATWFGERPEGQGPSKAQFVAIPSTSSGGSETMTTPLDTGEEVPFMTTPHRRAQQVVPDFAIFDPAITMTMGLSLTANTGFDALTHAYEAYVSLLSSDLTDGLAIKAIRLVFGWLGRSVHDDQDLAAHEKMHNAALLAGAASGNAATGLVHSLSHQLGSEFGLPHGRGNALLLAYVLAFNGSVAAERHVEIAKALGLRAPEPKEANGYLVAAVRDLQRKVGIPLAIQDEGLSQEAFLGAVDALAAQAMHHPSTIWSPRRPTRDDIKSLFLQAWHGSDPQIG